MISRRTFMALVSGGLFAAPLVAEARQAKKVWRIGFLSAGSSPTNLAVKGPFLQGLEDDLGYV
jgi:hypothetical protein